MMKIGIGNLIVLVFALSGVGTDFITDPPDEMTSMEVTGDSRTGMFVQKPDPLIM